MSQTPEAPRTVTMDKIVALSKRRGFVFPGSDIYGGLANTWDYGPLGVELRNNVKQLWWRTFIHRRRDMLGQDAGILMNPRVWEASGHVVNFNDPLVDCRTCKARFRADTLVEDKLGTANAGSMTPEELTALITQANLPCPQCGNRTLTGARQFNMMFSTTIGPVSDSSTKVYLRPETAQGIFVQYKNMINTQRMKLPFGVGQIGKAFRNEITPGNFIFRVLEFEQMEIEYFVRPDAAPTAFEEWLQAQDTWIDLIGLNREFVRVREHDASELSHYSDRTCDHEYLFPGSMGWKELYGLANRTDFDLRSHQQASGEDLRYFDQASGERFLPYVIEPTFGLERTILTLLVDAYDEESTTDVNGKEDSRTVLRFAPRVAPFKAAILPLAKKPELTTVAWELFERIQDETSALVDYDETANIGKRYRRQDEIGTPFCITVDFESLEDGAVTIRERDSMAQERVSMREVGAMIAERIR